MLRFIRHRLGCLYRLLLAHAAPRRLAGMLYSHVAGKALDWKHPRDINEKINWLKFYSDTSWWSILSDKYNVRHYVERCGFGDTLVRLYGRWENVEDIDWAALPSRFVMKLNNGSGDVLVCEDKSTLDMAAVERTYRALLKKKFGYALAEPHYNRICPCIIVEELLDKQRQMVPSSSLIDFKVWTFGGTPAYVFVYLNRTDVSVEMAVYDSDWRQHNEHIVPTEHFRVCPTALPRPRTLARMLEAASALSEGFPQVRVDFYEVEDRLYFGEMTFTASAGYMDHFTEDFLLELGAKCRMENVS